VCRFGWGVQEIAKECGILNEHGYVLEGPEFRKMTPQELDRVLPKLQVSCNSRMMMMMMMMGKGGWWSRG
jgi:hypothetical protein